MEIWEVDKLVLFLVFFIPGFVSLKVYDLFIPGEQRDFSKSVFEVVAYSALNFASVSWLIIWLISKDISESYRWWCNLSSTYYVGFSNAMGFNFRSVQKVEVLNKIYSTSFQKTLGLCIWKKRILLGYCSSQRWQNDRWDVW